MPNTGVVNQRVEYREGQRLTVADLSTEQDYLVDLWLQHNTQLHTPGIVRGLAIHQDANGQIMVQPGLAVDRLGRYLIVPAPLLVTAPSPAGGAIDVWLIYCRQPLRPRQRGQTDCSPNNVSRSREFARALSTPADSLAPDPSAVLLGRINPGATEFAIDYAGLRGSQVANPAGRGLLQVGPATGFDRNHFVLTLPDAAGVRQRRVVIDRDGKTSIYGDAELTSYRARLLLATSDPGTYLLAESRLPGLAGERIALLAPSPSSKRYAFGDLLTPGAGPPDTFLATGVKATLEGLLHDFNKKSNFVTLKLLPANSPEIAAVPRLQPDEDRDVPLTTAGGDVSFYMPPAPIAPVIPPDCPQPPTLDNPFPLLQNSLSMVAAKAPLPGPAARRIFAIAVKENGQQVEQVRLDLGAQISGDESDRFSIGAPPKTGDPFLKWLTVGGNGRVSIDPTAPAPTPADLDKLPVSIRVTGSVEFSPIKPNPADPDFKFLVVAAFLNGLRSVLDASSVVTIAIVDPPAVIEIKRPWQYDVQLLNTGATAVKIDIRNETRRIAGLILPGDLPAPNGLAANETKKFTVQHQDPMPAGDLQLEALVTGTIGKLPWWNSASPPHPIPVVEKPDLNFADLPDSASPNTPFDYKITLRNNDLTRKMILAHAHLSEGGPTLDLLTASEELAATLKRDFVVSHNAGITAPLDVNLTVDYQWEGGPLWNIAGPAAQRIDVATHLNVTIDTAPASAHAGDAWKFTVHLENPGGASVNVTTLEHRRSTDPTWTTIVAPGQIDGGHSKDTAPIDEPASAAGTITLEVRFTYDRSGRTWAPPVIKKDITVT